eukprot:361100-Chlamydomonas_euryale.AAC.23
MPRVCRLQRGQAKLHEAAGTPRAAASVALPCAWRLAPATWAVRVRCESQAAPLRARPNRAHAACSGTMDAPGTEDEARMPLQACFCAKAMLNGAL